MGNVGKPHIKNEILQGVYKENLRLSTSQVKTDCPVQQRQSNRSRINFGFTTLIITMIICLVEFFAYPIYHQAADSIASLETSIPFLFDQTYPAHPSETPVSTLLAKEMNAATPHVKKTSVPKATNYMVIRPPVISEPAPRPMPAFDTERLLDYNFLFNADQIRLSSVFGLEIQTIVIDPGHGGKDPGAIGSEGTREKDIVMDIALRLRDKLMQSGQYTVLLTRETDTFISLADRVEFSNSNKADLFISLHINALPQKESNVTETFYFGPPTEAYTLRLAEQENRGSQILSGDFKNMIEKIGLVLKQQESANLATTIQDSLFSNLEKYDREIVNNGTKIAPFVVLLGVDAPSVLVEISCISKKEEEEKLNDTAYRERIIISLEAGITGYLSNRHTQVVKGDSNGKKIGNKNG